MGAVNMINEERNTHATTDKHLTKVEKMDKSLKSMRKEVTGKEVREVITATYGIDLNHISENNYGSKLSAYHVSVMENLRRSLNVETDSTEMDAQIMAMTKNEVMDRYIEVHDQSLTGAQLRDLANQIYGTNLTGISALEHSRLSIRSKGQWVRKGPVHRIVKP
jgi:predicted transcriptional regulator